jgi:hypothetical protein
MSRISLSEHCAVRLLERIQVDNDAKWNGHFISPGVVLTDGTVEFKLLVRYVNLRQITYF